MTSAATVYRAELDVPVGRRKIVDRLLWPVRLVAAGLGVVDETILGDVVVHRISDGAEVLRLPVEGTEESSNQLTVIRAELAETTAEEFEAAWEIA